MKLRFDTYTKNVQTATKAFDTLYKYCDELSIDKSGWQEGVINLTGQIDSSNVNVLEQVTANDFNEDATKL
jgi:FtsZ-binding cell division protein ZapB